MFFVGALFDLSMSWLFAQVSSHCCFSFRFRVWWPAGSCFFWPALVESVLIIRVYACPTCTRFSRFSVSNSSLITTETWPLSSGPWLVDPESVGVTFLCVVSSVQSICLFKITTVGMWFSLWSGLHPPLQDLFWEECWEEAPSSPIAMEMSEFSRVLLNASQIWQLNTLTWAWYHRLHFYIFMLNVIQWSTSSHLHHVLFWTCTGGKAAILLYLKSLILSVHFILFVTLLPLWRLLSSLLHHHLHALLSVWIRLQLLLSLPPCFFSKTKSWLMEEKRLSLCVVISFYFLCFSICHFVLLEIHEQRWKMWLIKM